MDTGIKIQGGTLDPVAAASVTASIEQILTTAFETHMDQETVRHALDTFGSMATINGTTIQHAHFDGGKTVNLDLGDED